MWIFLALLSGLGAAVLATVIKLYLNHINSFFVTLLFSVVTMVILLVAAFFTDKIEPRLVATLTGREWTALIVAGCLNSFAFICYLSALKGGSTGGVVAIDRLGIVFALILAAIFLQESLTIKSLAGGIMMVFGAVLVTL
jgi:transporter family protein